MSKRKRKSQWIIEAKEVVIRVTARYGAPPEAKPPPEYQNKNSDY